jgi:hypothetical protein
MKCNLTNRFNRLWGKKVHRMRFKMFIGAILLTWSPQVATTQIDLDQIFWSQKKTAKISGIELLASYRSLNSTSFLFRNIETSELLVVDESEIFNLKNRSLRIKSINVDSLIFESEHGQIFTYQLTDFFVNNSSSLKDVISKNIEFDEGNDEIFVILDESLEAAGELLRYFGLPNFLLRDPSNYLKVSRSRAGRPGLELKAELPEILLDMTPFKRRDVILTVDSISTADIDMLLLHLQNNSKNGVFDVEIERAGKLKLLRVSK